MHRRWLSLPLLASSVSAFYPYHSGDKDSSDGKDKRFIPMSTPDQTSNGPDVVTLDIKKIPTKRQNAFPVVLSNKPNAPNAIAIDQDGSDYSYFSVMSFGSKGQNMYMLIDTGSANTWVMGSSCTSSACKIHNLFGSSKSNTLNITTQTWQLAYGTGEVDGVVASDKVSFANYNINLEFGLVTSASDDFNNYPMDGILGLGPTASNQLGTPTVMQTLDQQTNLQNNILGIHLNRASDGSKDGQLTIGGLDNSKFKGPLNYLSISNPNSWEIPVDDMIVGGKACKFTGKSAIIDTGTSYILMPPGDAQIMHAQIPGSAQSGESYTVPCGTTTQVQVSFAGVKYKVSPKDYVGKPSGGACSSNIIGHQAFGPNEWIMGDVFLKNVYSVFDFDKDRIGFGTMDGIAAPSSAAASASSAAAASSSPAPTSGASGASATKTSSASSSGLTTMTTATKSGSSVSSTSDGGTSTTTSANGGNGDPFGGSSGSSSSSSASGTSDAVQHHFSVSWMLAIAFVVGLSV